MADNKVEIRVTASGAEQTARILQQVAKEGGQLGIVTASGAKQAEQALNSLGGTAKRVFEIFTGVSLANITTSIATMAAQAVKDLTRIGLENQRVEESFTRMAASVGVSADALLASLRDASAGIVDTNDIMLASSKALAQGLNAEQLTRVMETARAQATLAGKTVSESFNTIADAVTTLNVKQLRSFGIVIDLQKAYESYAKTLGTTAAALSETGQRAAILAAIDEQTRKNRLALTEGELTNAQAIEKAKAKWSDFFAVQAAGFANAYTWFIKGGAAFLEWKEKQVNGLEDLAARWEKYKGATFWGKGTAFPSPLPPPTVSPTEAGGMLGGRESRVAASTAGHVDRLKAATLELDNAFKLLNATMQAGLITGAEFEAGLVAQIAKLQALGKSLDEDGRIKLLNLMATLKTFREQNAAPISDIIAGVTGKLAEATAGGGSIGPELEKIATALAKLPNLTKESRDRLVEWAAGMLLATAEAKRFQAELDATTQAWLKHDLAIAAGGDPAEALLRVQERLIVTLQQQDEQMAAGAQSGTAYMDSLRKLAIEGADKAEASLKALQETVGKTGPELVAAQLAASLLGKAFSELDESTKKWLLRMAGAQIAAKELRSSLDFQAQLTGIANEAALVGSNFDAAGARLSAFKQRILELQAIKNPTGEILAEIDELKAKFADTRDFIQWRDTFEGIFASVGGAINTLVQGVILGTQTIGEAFKRLAQSIIINFVNAVIQQALNPLVKAAAQVVAGLFSAGGAAAAAGGGGGGGAGGGVGGFGGGGGFDWSGLFSSASNLFGSGGTLSKLFGSGGTLWAGVTGIAANWAAGTSAVGSFSNVLLGTADTLGELGLTASNATQGLLGFGGTMSSMASFTGYAAAALQGFAIIMDKTKSDLGKGIQTAILAAGIGLAGFTGGISLLVAPILNVILDLFGIFEKGISNYDKKRMDAGDAANAALGNAATAFEDALKTMDPAKILGVLQVGGAGGAVRSELVLPTGIAQQIGLTGQQIGDQIVTQWRDVTLEQFEKILAVFKEQPALIQGIRGSGDVPYLAQGDAQAIADAIAGGAQALLTAFTELAKVRDKITETADKLIGIGEKILPSDELAQAFATQVNRLRDRMIALLSSGLPVDEMKKQMDALAQEMEAFGGLVALYGTLEQDIARLSRDLAGQTKAMILGITLALDAANSAVEDARSRATEAISPQEVLAANVQLREAILGRYNLELKMIAEIQAAIGAIRQQMAAATGQQIEAAVFRLSTGDVAAFDALYEALVNLARFAPTAAERLEAIILGIQAVSAASLLVAKHLANAAQILTPTGEVIPTEIWATIVTQAEPFLTELSDLIAEALDVGDLAGGLMLLQQEVALLQQVAADAVAAVNAWAQAAIQATNEAAAAMVEAINTNWDDLVDLINKQADAQIMDIEAARDVRVAALDAEIDKIEQAAEARITALEAEIEAIQDAAQATQDAIAAQIEGLQRQGEALQEQIRATREWEQVVKTIGDYLRQLDLGGFSAMNPAQQLGLAQQNLNELFAAFQAAPTAAGAADVQAAAQALLPIAETVFSRPSAEFGAIFDRIRAIMQAVQGTAAAEAGPLTSAQLEKQAKMLADAIKALQEQSRQIGETAQAQAEAIRKTIEATRKAAQDQVDALRDEMRAVEQSATDQITAIEAARDQAIKDAEAGRAHDLALVEKWRDAQIKAIETTRAETIRLIGLELATQLEVNAAAQKAILTELLGAQEDALQQITQGVPLQAFMAQRALDTVTELKAINVNIGKALTARPLSISISGGGPGGGGAPLPSGDGGPSPWWQGGEGGDPGAIAEQARIHAEWWAWWNSLTAEWQAAFRASWDAGRGGYVIPEDFPGGAGPTGPSQHQAGSWYTAPGPAILHAGEMVLPQRIAAIVRRGAEGEQHPVQITNHFTVTGANPEAIAKAIEARIERSARFGKLGKIIQDKR